MAGSDGEITSATLAVEIRLSRQAGRMSERLGRHAVVLARRYLHGGRFSGYPEAVREDMVSCFLEKFAVRWHGVEADGNPFSYVTAMVRSAAWDYVKKHKRRIRREETYQKIETIRMM